jgi:hypothetical protein
MKIRVYIAREFDTEEWRDGDPDYPEHVDPEIEMEHAINMFCDDIDYLVKYNEVKDQARVEVWES